MGSPVRPQRAGPGSSLGDELGFRRWYADRAKQLGLDPDPDNPQHFYDYRAAYTAGAEPDASGHWPSRFKREGHPRQVVGGVDTRTGELPASRVDAVAKRLERELARANARGIPSPEPTGNEIFRTPTSEEVAAVTGVQPVAVPRPRPLDIAAKTTVKPDVTAVPKPDTPEPEASGRTIGGRSPLEVRTSRLAQAVRQRRGVLGDIERDVGTDVLRGVKTAAGLAGADTRNLETSIRTREQQSALDIAESDSPRVRAVAQGLGSFFAEFELGKTIPFVREVLKTPIEGEFPAFQKAAMRITLPEKVAAESRSFAAFEAMHGVATGEAPADIAEQSLAGAATGAAFPLAGEVLGAGRGLIAGRLPRRKGRIPASPAAEANAATQPFETLYIAKPLQSMSDLELDAVEARVLAQKPRYDEAKANISLGQMKPEEFGGNVDAADYDLQVLNDERIRRAGTTRLMAEAVMPGTMEDILKLQQHIRTGQPVDEATVRRALNPSLDAIRKAARARADGLPAWAARSPEIQAPLRRRPTVGARALVGLRPIAGATALAGGYAAQREDLPAPLRATAGLVAGAALFSALRGIKGRMGFLGDQTHFFSRMEARIKEAPFEKGTAQQWLAQVSKNVSEDELKYTGLRTLLEDAAKGQGELAGGKTVGKTDLLALAKQRQLPIDDYVLSDEYSTPHQNVPDLDNLLHDRAEEIAGDLGALGHAPQGAERDARSILHRVADGEDPTAIADEIMDRQVESYQQQGGSTLGDVEIWWDELAGDKRTSVLDEVQVSDKPWEKLTRGEKQDVGEAYHREHPGAYMMPEDELVRAHQSLVKSLTEFKTDHEAAVQAVAMAEAAPDMKPQWDRYVLPGGVDYREILLTLDPSRVGAFKEAMPPGIEVRQYGDGFYAAVDAKGNPIGGSISESQARTQALAAKAATQPFTWDHSSHWPNWMNVIAHARVNTRFRETGTTTTKWRTTGAVKGIEFDTEAAAREWLKGTQPGRADIEKFEKADREKVLFLEELQSDWANASREEGTSDPIALGKLLARLNDLSQRDSGRLWTEGDLRNFSRDGLVDDIIRLSRPDGSATPERLAAEHDFLRSYDAWRDSPGTTPPGPFNKTESWMGLVMRKILHEAYEEGFDRIAWINGAQTAKRWSQAFADRIDEIRWEVVGNEKVEIEALRGGQRVTVTPAVPPEELHNWIGDAMAKQVIDAHQGGDYRGTLRGENLTVGDHSHVLPYDEILPRVVRKDLAKMLGVEIPLEKVRFPEMGKTENYSAYVGPEVGLQEVTKLMQDFRDRHDIHGDYENVQGDPAYKARRAAILRELPGPARTLDLNEVDDIYYLQRIQQAMERRAFTTVGDYIHAVTNAPADAQRLAQRFGGNLAAKTRILDAPEQLSFRVTPEIRNRIETRGIPIGAATEELVNTITAGGLGALGGAALDEEDRVRGFMAGLGFGVAAGKGLPIVAARLRRLNEVGALRLGRDIPASLVDRTLEDHLAILRDIGKPEAAENLKKFMEGSQVQKVVFRGDNQGQRLGNRMLKKEASSGRFYFTADPDVAAGYASGKSWTPEQSGFEQYYQFPRGKGEAPRNMNQAWYGFTPEEKGRLVDTLLRAHIPDTWEGGQMPIEFGEIGDSIIGGMQGWEWYVKMNRGDWLRAAKEIWLESGAMFDQEELFGQILKHAGIDFQYEHPQMESPSVTPVFLQIRKPIDAYAPPADFVHAIREAIPGSSHGATGKSVGTDIWADMKRNFRPWAETFLRNVEDKDGLWTTALPEKAVKIAQSLGYDGIRDLGGKYGGVRNEQWIAFEPGQIKSAIGNNGDFSAPFSIVGAAPVGTLAKTAAVGAGAAAGAALSPEEPGKGALEGAAAAVAVLGAARLAGHLGAEPVERALARPRALSHPRPKGTVEGDFEVQYKGFDLPPSTLQKLEDQAADLKAKGTIAKRRVSWDEQKAVAASLGIEDINKAWVNNDVDGTTLLAMRNVYRQSVEEQGNAIARLKAIETGAVKPGEGEMSRLLRSVDELEAEQRGLLRMFIPKASEMGRNLNALKILANATLDPLAWHARAQKMAGRILTPEELSRINDLVGKGDREALVQFVQGLAPPIKTFSIEALLQLRRAGLLTGIRTQARNFLSNMSETLLRAADNPVQVVADRLASVVVARASNGRIPDLRTRAFLSPGERFEAGMTGATKGVAEMGKVMRGELDAGSLQKLDLRPQQHFQNRFLDGYTKFMFRSMTAADRPFRQAAFQESLREQAKVLARGISDKAERARRVVELTDKPPDDMVLQAIADSEEAVFANRSVAGEFVKGMRSGLLRAEARGGVLGFGAKNARYVLDFVIPFQQTPGAVLGRLVERTPLGYLSSYNGLRQLAREASRKSIDLDKVAFLQKDATGAFGRATTGTLAIMLGFMLAKKGVASGAWPYNDQKKANSWKQEGRTEDSILLGGRWRKLTGVSPLGNLVALGAQIYHDLSNPDYQPAERIGAAGLGAARSFLDQSFMRGLQDLIEGIQNSEGSGAERSAKAAGASFVPTIVADLTNVIDPRLREPETITDAVKAKIPGYSFEVPVKLDEFGKPMVYTEEEGATRAVDPFLSRTPATTGDAVRTELARIGVAVPGVAREKDEKTGVPEATEAWRARRVAIGTARRAALEAMLDMRQYKQLDDEERADVADRVLSAVRRTVTQSAKTGHRLPTRWSAIIGSELRASRIAFKKKRVSGAAPPKDRIVEVAKRDALGRPSQYRITEPSGAPA